MSPEPAPDSEDMIAQRLREAGELVAFLRSAGAGGDPMDGSILLGLVGLPPELPWSEAQGRRAAVEDVVGYANKVYPWSYGELTRDAIRERLMGFLQEGWVQLYHPEDTNDSRSIYQICPEALELVRSFNTEAWPTALVNYQAKRNAPPDAFILYNEKESGIRDIVDELDGRGIKTYYWHYDIPLGEDWVAFEADKLEKSFTVVLFLGRSGWGPHHLRLAEEAREQGKKIIPVLIGDASPSDLDKAGRIFRELVYQDLRTLSERKFDELAAAIRRLAATQPTQVSLPRNLEIDTLIGQLKDGNEQERLQVLDLIEGLPPDQRESLAHRLRGEIDGSFNPESVRDPASLVRAPGKISSIRSWMLSALIWTNGEDPASRDCIVRHLSGLHEPEEDVRFWVLAGLDQRKISYLKQVAEICLSDSAAVVAHLASAIYFPADSELQQRFRGGLSAPAFSGPRNVLRALRVHPIPELIPDICDLIGQTREGISISYDAFYALTNPAVREEAAKILSENPGTEGTVRQLVQEVADSDENAARNFAMFLTQFDADEVDRALAVMLREQELERAARIISGILRAFRHNESAKIFQPTYSPFAPDRTVALQGKKLEDSLKVGTYASHLAQLIAAKKTPMPLSIGLFGPWGSGKSHFIDLIEEQLKEIERNPGDDFHGSVVQIRFNAWHYLDTNLWANLVCEIFDQLFSKLGEKQTTEQQIEALKKKLTDQSALAAEANSALALAEKARKDAEDKLSEAIKNRSKQEDKVGGLLDELGTLLSTSPEIQKSLEEVAGKLGLPEIKSSFADLEARALEARSLSGRVKATALAVLSGPSWWKNLLLVAVAAAIPFVPGWLAKLNLSGFSAALTQIIAAVTALSTWLTSQVKAGSKIAGMLEESYDKVKAVRAAKELDADTKKAKEELALEQQKEEQARLALTQAEERVNLIRAELAELAPGRQLIRFLKSRATAEDYRRHLGLVSLVRRDFDQLSQLLLNASNNKDPELPQIDRIVLYIDDLDRCRADRVVEVLEAVHLLLAFPLFTVLVAVDPRWLRQSLLDEYPHLLGASEPEEQRRRGGQPATPQDYLEKIFQVPFNLQPIDDAGYRTLVRKLFSAEEPPEAQSSTGTGGDAPPVDAPPVDAPPADAPPADAPPADAPPAGAPPAGAPPAGAPPADGPPADAPPADAPPAGTPVTTVTGATGTAGGGGNKPRRLILTSFEIADFEQFQPLFQTPRSVKRFANTYCLLRVGVEAGDWTEFLGAQSSPGAYRLPMFLLAVASAFPTLARPWLEHIRDSSSFDWTLSDPEIERLAETHADSTSREDWERLGRQLKQLPLKGWKRPAADGVSRWVSRVARYSF